VWGLVSASMTPISEYQESEFEFDESRKSVVLELGMSVFKLLLVIN